MDNTHSSQTTDRPKLRILGAADLHVHTLPSYDVIPTRQVEPRFLYLKARRLGMTYVAFTDHDTMAAYDQIGRLLESPEAAA